MTVGAKPTEDHTPKSVAAVYRRIEEQIAGPIRQVPSLAQSGETRPQVASLGHEVPLRPGSGLEAKITRKG